MTTRPCPYCDGRAVVKRPEMVALEVLRELERIALEGVSGGLRIELHPEVCEHLETELAEHLNLIRSTNKLNVTLLAKKGFHHEQFDIIEH